LDAGQESDVGNLFGGLVLLDRFQQPLVAEDETVDLHAGLVALGDAPAAVVHAFERAVIGVLWHGSFLKPTDGHPWAFKYRQSLPPTNRRSFAPPSERGR